jgi:hypothetical protein
MWASLQVSYNFYLFNRQTSSMLDISIFIFHPVTHGNVLEGRVMSMQRKAAMQLKQKKSAIHPEDAAKKNYFRDGMLTGFVRIKCQKSTW